MCKGKEKSVLNYTFNCLFVLSEHPLVESGGALIKKISLKGGPSFERGGLSRRGAHSIKYGTLLF